MVWYRTNFWMFFLMEKSWRLNFRRNCNAKWTMKGIPGQWLSSFLGISLSFAILRLSSPTVCSVLICSLTFFPFLRTKILIELRMSYRKTHTIWAISYVSYGKLEVLSKTCLCLLRFILWDSFANQTNATFLNFRNFLYDAHWQFAQNKKSNENLS